MTLNLFIFLQKKLKF